MNRTIPILFTIPNFITAGSGREMLHIVERLDRNRFAPAVGVLRKGGPLDAEVERLGLPLIEAAFAVATAPFATLLVRAWKAARVFRPYRFEIWHSFHWSSDYTEPLIARLAGAGAWIYTKKNMNWDRRAWHLRTLLASRIVARNQTMLERLFVDRWYRSKTRLIYGGVDSIRFCPETAPRLGLREQLSISDGEIVAACVAQLVPIKGHPTLLRAVAQIDGLHLWLAGKPLDQAYVQDLHRLVDALKISDRVHFCSHVTDMPAFLAEADMFVLPTSLYGGHEEGCPVALLEAMAAGKACIASDVAGSRDLIEDGVCGILVRPDHVTDLAGALHDLAAAPEQRRRLGHTARQRVESKYTLENESAQMQALYEEVLR